jgi:hypothetical protein
MNWYKIAQLEKLIFEDGLSGGGMKGYRRVSAFLPNYFEVGHVTYVLNDENKSIYIVMLRTENEFKRQRVATQILNFLKNKYKGYSIEYNTPTEEGQKFVDNYFNKREYNELV